MDGTEAACEWCGEPARGTATDSDSPWAVKLSCGHHGRNFVPIEDEDSTAPIGR